MKRRNYAELSAFANKKKALSFAWCVDVEVSSHIFFHSWIQIIINTESFGSNKSNFRDFYFYMCYEIDSIDLNILNSWLNCIHYSVRLAFAIITCHGHVPTATSLLKDGNKMQKSTEFPSLFASVPSLNEKYRIDTCVYCNFCASQRNWVRKNGVFVCQKRLFISKSSTLHDLLGILWIGRSGSQ